MPPLLVLVALAACGPGTRPDPGALPAAEGPPRAWRLEGRGAPVVRVLDHLDAATFQLPDDNLPPEGATGGRFLLADGWRRGRGDVWTHPSPQAFHQVRFRAAPAGVRLERHGEALPYHPGTAEKARRTDGWEIVQDVIHLASPEDPGLDPPTFVVERLADLEARLNRSLSGLPPERFARARPTLAGLTRDALLVPAPGRVEVTLTLPAGRAVLRAGAGIADPSGRGEARATARILVDGAVAWEAGLEAGEPWLEFTVDLSEHAGDTVRLTFQSDPGRDPVGDFVAFATPEIVGPPTPEGPRRILLVGIDTLRPDHLGVSGHRRDTSPVLDRFAEQAIVFTHAWAPAPRTRPSFRTALTGRWPLAAITAPTLASVLADAGFTTAGIVANVHLSPRLGFDAGSGWWDYHDGARADEQVERATRWLAAHADEDAFLFLHLMDPHVFYLPPEPWRDLFTDGLDRGVVDDRFNRWIVEEWQRRGLLDEDARAFIEARYDGEIAWLDHNLAALFRAVDELPGSTLVIVHSDHGEEFWEHGGYEHNHTLYDELVRAMLWVRPPGGWTGGPHRVDVPVSLADIAPTLWELAGVPPADRPPADGRSLVPLLQPGGDAAFPRDRPLQLGHLMFDRERWGVVRDGGKYVLQTATGREELYDLRADPHEQHDLAATTDLSPWWAALSEATGWPVGPGLRVHLRGPADPFTLSFPEPVRAAGVIDPEAARLRRANLEWGEVPDHTRADVATVTLSDDRRTVRVAPGPWARGTVYVLGPAGVAGATVHDAAGERRLVTGPQLLGGRRGAVTPGTIIVPTDTEARRLAAEHDPDAIEALRALGYVE